MGSAFVFLIKGSFWKQGFILGFSLFLAADCFRNCYTGVNCLSSFSFLWSHFRHYGVFLSCLHLWTHSVLVWRWKLIYLFLFALVRPMLFFWPNKWGRFGFSVWALYFCLILSASSKSMVSYAVSLGCSYVDGLVCCVSGMFLTVCFSTNRLAYCKIGIS